MRKQELKSRKKVHARKRGRKGTRPYSKKEVTVEKYKPEVITIEETKKGIKERMKAR
ncbi:MAG: hypothetical protein ACETVM_02115 [Candidatus Bathyarchaeia archaeon]